MFAVRPGRRHGDPAEGQRGGPARRQVVHDRADRAEVRRGDQDQRKVAALVVAPVVEADRDRDLLRRCARDRQHQTGVEAMQQRVQGGVAVALACHRLPSPSGRAVRQPKPFVGADDDRPPTAPLP